MAYTIDIDSYIGVWYDSNTYKMHNTKKDVKNILAIQAGKPVTARVNSLGGDVDHALDISAQFEAHGDVTVEMFAFNASAATVFTLGAKKVKAHIDSLYLIHKAMSWVDNWGYMNEDDIQKVIDELEQEKKENEKVTLVLARKYAAKSGKSITDILNLMKEQTWLTAVEAKEWGFVDEVFGKSEGKVNFSDVMKAKFNAAELPIPTRFNNNQEEFRGFFSAAKAEMTEIINNVRALILDKKTDNNDNPVINMKKDWTHVNTLLGVDGVEVKDGKVNLAEDQLTKLNDEIKSATEGKSNAETDLTTKTNEYNELLEKYNALKGAPGASSNDVNKDTDGGSGQQIQDDALQAAVEAKKMFNLLNK